MHRQTRTRTWESGRKVSTLRLEARDSVQLFSSQQIQFRGIYYPAKFYQGVIFQGVASREKVQPASNRVPSTFR